MHACMQNITANDWDLELHKSVTKDCDSPFNMQRCCDRFSVTLSNICEYPSKPVFWFTLTTYEINFQTPVYLL